MKRSALKTLFFIGYVIFFGHFLQAKEISKIHYSTAEGLPSSEVYCAHQDKKGYMWFGTDRGLARFDGHKFKVYTTKDGLTDNVIFKIYEDKVGKLWLYTYRGGFCYLQNGKIYQYEYNHFFKNWYANRTLISMRSVPPDNMEFSFRGVIETYLIAPDGTVTKKRAVDSVKHQISVSNETVFVQSYQDTILRQINFILNGKVFKHSLKKHEKEILLELIASRVPNFLQSSLDFEKEAVFLSAGSSLFRIDTNGFEFIKSFKRRILSIGVNEGKVIVGFYKGGYKFLEAQSYQVIFEDDLDENSVASIGVDKNDGLWLTTLENGIFYLPQTTNYVLTTKDGLTSNYILNIDGNDDEYVLIDGLGKVSVHNTENYDLITSFTSYNRSSRSKVKYDRYKKQFYIVRLETKTLKNGAFLEDTFPGGGMSPINSDSTAFFYLSKGVLNFGYTDKENNYSGIFFTLASNAISNFQNVFVTKTGRVLLGSLTGLFELKNNNLIALGAKNKVFNSRIDEIIEMEGYSCVISTRDVGLIFMRGDSLKIFGENEGLASNQISSLFFDEYSGDLWIGSSKGLSILKRNGSIVNVDLYNGLSSNEINDIFVTDDKGFVATKRGLAVIKKSTITENIEDIPIYFESMMANNNEVIIDSSKVEINFDTKFFEVKCIGVSFGSAEDLRYAYRLKNQFDDWQISETGTLAFTSLPAGDYLLEVVASADGVNWSSIPASLELHVAYPFWQRTWFLLLLAVLVALIGFTIFKIGVARVNKKNKQKFRVNELKMKALNAQMNPHFIFNSLNSVQNFIMKNNKTEANRFLSKFSKLMRKILQHSEKVSITIKEEIEALTLYLDLEIVRFDEEISYNYFIDESIDLSNALLPTLLLQPIVENSIWHGIRNSGEKGIINIVLSKEKENLVLSVEDNGVGVNSNMYKKKVNHVSKGMTLLAERTQLFCEAYNVNSSFEIHDLSDIKQGRGTRVTITIPYITENYESTNN